jgi:phage gpG-like protein
VLSLRVTIPNLDAQIARVDRMAAAFPVWAALSMSDVERILRESVAEQSRSVVARSEVARRLRPSGGPQNLIRRIESSTSGALVSLRLELEGLAIYHQGGTTAAESALPGKKVPARPFMTLTDGARSAVRDRMREPFQGIIRGAG